MKFLLSSGLALSILLPCGDVCAQFTAPPTSPPPVCDREKNLPPGDPVGSACKAGILVIPLASTHVMLECVPHNGSVACNAFSEWFDGAQWQAFDPSRLLYAWDFVVDGQEYHFGPTHDASIWVDCGYTRHGYVRVTAEGSTAMVGFACSAVREALDGY
jgi:hypothetical protein